MKLNIVRCPPGFVLSGSANGVEVCECGSSAPGLTCNAALSQTHLNYCYWVGYIGNGSTSDSFQSGPCPGFCRAHTLILEGSDHYNLDRLDDEVCSVVCSSLDML